MDLEQRKIAKYFAEEMANWLESKKDIPNAEKLIKKLRTNKHHEGHTVHANVIKNIYESKQHKITDVENDSGNFDVDIQLDNSINIQVQYGASVATYNAERGFVSPLGGVRTDWNKDEQKIFSKINQLPNDGLGILFQYAYGLGSHILPEWRNKLPDNKVIVLAYNESDGITTYGVAEIHCSENFNEIEKIKQVVNSAGFNVKGVFVGQNGLQC